MPGAQAEEPPADEERSEPVQVGGGAFLGRDDIGNRANTWRI